MDRFIRGFLAGVAGGLVMNAWVFLAASVLGWQVKTFIDWSGVILFGHLPETVLESIIALAIQLFWAGFLGILLAFLIPQMTSREYLLKGVVLGIIAGFTIYAVPIVLQTPILSNHSTLTVISNQIGGILWGITTAQTLYWLDSTKRIKT